MAINAFSGAVEQIYMDLQSMDILDLVRSQVDFRGNKCSLNMKGGKRHGQMINLAMINVECEHFMKDRE